MKAIYSLTFMAGLILCLFACKKDNTLNASIVGKWYVNKEEIKEVTGGVSKVLDTTYSGNAFTTADYFQFNSDGTASLSTSGDFEVYGKATATDGAGNIIDGKDAFTYSVSGSLLTLTSTFFHPTPNSVVSAPATDTIVLLDANNLILQSTIGQNSLPEITYITYYKRGN